METGEPFGDDSHIIYVNGAYRDSSDIGKLMHDFSCSNADDMNYGYIAERTRYFKNGEKGVSFMCKIMEDRIIRKSKKFAKKLIKSEDMSLEKIAEYSELPLEEVKKLAEEIKK